MEVGDKAKWGGETVTVRHGFERAQLERMTERGSYRVIQTESGDAYFVPENALRPLECGHDWMTCNLAGDLRQCGKCWKTQTRAWVDSEPES
jgi:hypothetical protein